MIDISLTLSFLYFHIRYTATMYIIAYYIIADKCTSSPKIMNITTTKPQGGTHLSIYTHKYWLCTCKWETPSGKSRVSWNLGNKVLKRLVRVISTTCGGYNYLDRKLPIWSQGAKEIMYACPALVWSSSVDMMLVQLASMVPNEMSWWMLAPSSNHTAVFIPKQGIDLRL